jgi:hypothetical protein
MDWARWPPAPTGWCVAVDPPTALPRHVRPVAAWVIHVVAERASVDGTGTTPGIEPGAEGLIPAQMVAELARTASLQPLLAPTDGPEPRCAPSARLADFVRCRDLTCRAPGCDRPAVDCDLDHTVAYSDGGRTHASNLKALCRRHYFQKAFMGSAYMSLAVSGARVPGVARKVSSRVAIRLYSL